MLEQFFAVTLTSLYRVSAEKDKNIPIVEKISKRAPSKIEVGEMLRGGYEVGILDDSIILFTSSPSRNDRDPIRVNIAFWGGNTSPIVALFLEEKDARICLESGSQNRWDPDYIDNTKETLRAIGKNHPVFIISESVPVKY